MTAMSKRTFIAIAVLAAVGIGVASYRVSRSRQEAFCGFCHRTLHANTRVVAEIDGGRRQVCCARCAISEAYQERKPVHLISVTDYVSGQTLDPKLAYFVDGSQKVLCVDGAAMVDETKHAYQRTFDRCSPGTYAFARLKDADAFIQENGGTLLHLEELIQQVGAQ